MTEYIEELAKQHLWYWMRNKKDWDVDGEVNTHNGRIDIVAKNDEDEYIGVEIKAKVNYKFKSKVSEQVNRYMKTELFDRIYIATPYPDSIKVAMDERSVALPVVREACQYLSTGIYENKYTRNEVINRLNEGVSKDILQYDYSDYKSVSEYINDNIKSSNKMDESISIDAAIETIENSIIPEEVGLIGIPLTIEENEFKNPEKDLNPENIDNPHIVRSSEKHPRKKDPNFNREGEPWVRHNTWCEMGGIPEGHIPNTMDSSTPDRPIDILSFSDCIDPSKIIEDDSSGEIVGIEAKSKKGVSSKRTVSQLTQFIESESLSRLYLAVPNSAKERAVSVIESKSTLNKIGLITVEPNGLTEIRREAEKLEPIYDGYIRSGDIRKLGYGELSINQGSDVKNPFKLEGWRDSPNDNNGNPVTWDQDPTNYIDTLDSCVDSGEDEPVSLIDRIKGLFSQESSDPNIHLRESLRRDLEKCSVNEKIRSYLVQGYSSAPTILRDRPKKGYIRLTISDFETDENEYGLKFHFGAGSYEGGYIRILEDNIEKFCRGIVSARQGYNIKLTVQGDALDLTDDKSDFRQNKLGSEDRSEHLLTVNISAYSDNSGSIEMVLCEDQKRGVRVVMTDVQVLDLLKCVRISKFGRLSQIPNEGSYKRIGPSGEDTWDQGTSVEKEDRPKFDIET